MRKRKRKPDELRSHRWYGVEDLRAFGHRSRAAQMGYGREDYAGKPVIAILNTWSEINPCHTHFRARAEEVKRGVWQAGGFPVEMPAMSLSEPFQKPTTMMYRNLLAMEAEELLRSYPADGVVLMGGCDKTTPGLLMGAISMGLPAILVTAGPLLRGIGLDLPLQPTREQLFFFDTQDPAAFLPERMPFFREHGARHSTYDSPLHFYGIPNIDGCGFKASIHTNGENTDPDNTLRTVDDSVCELLRAFFRRHIPLADSPLKTGRVCLYTMTPDEHFILDQHPQHAHIAIGAGFSGHGFKFGVASGKILADLVTVGESSLDISLFALSRFDAGVN